MTMADEQDALERARIAALPDDAWNEWVQQHGRQPGDFDLDPGACQRAMNEVGSAAKWTPGKVFQIPVGGDLDPGAAHEPDPLEARVIALEARVAAMEAVVGMALARPRSIDR